MAFRERLNQWWRTLTSKVMLGQGLVEYALILVLVAVVVIAILVILGPAIRDVYENVLEQF